MKVTRICRIINSVNQEINSLFQIQIHTPIYIISTGYVHITPYRIVAWSTFMGVNLLISDAMALHSASVIFSEYAREGIIII